MTLPEECDRSVARPPPPKVWTVYSGLGSAPEMAYDVPEGEECGHERQTMARGSHVLSGPAHVLPARPPAPLLQLLARASTPPHDARRGSDARPQRLARERRAHHDRGADEGRRARLSLGRGYERPHLHRRRLPPGPGGVRHRLRLRARPGGEDRRAASERAGRRHRQRRLARRPRLRRRRGHDRRRERRERRVGGVEVAPGRLGRRRDSRPYRPPARGLCLEGRGGRGGARAYAGGSVGVTGPGPDVSVLLVTYRCAAETRACLESIRAGTREIDYEVVVLDNASGDGTAEMVRSEFPWVRLVASPENLGFAAGCNRAAAEASGEYPVLLNPDTLVHEGAIERLVAFARAHPEHGLYGGRTLDPDGTVNGGVFWGG